MQYLVKSNIRMGGKEYGIGDTIELTEEQAAAIPWAVEVMPDQPGAQEETAPTDGAGQTVKVTPKKKGRRG